MMRFAWWVVLGLVLGGCSNDLCGAGTGAGAARVAPQVPLAITGSPTRVSVSPTRCEELTGASAEVRGPGEVVVPSSVVGFALGGATVEFTAEVPGPHVVKVTFEPSGETRTTTVLALRDRSTEAPVLRVPSSPQCEEVALSRGAHVCLSQDRLTLGDARSWPAEFGARLVTAGDVVWAYDQQAVRRLEFEPDAGWSVVQGPGALQLRPAVVAASEARLLLSRAGTLVEFAVDGGALTSTEAPFEADPLMVGGLAVTDGGVVWLRETEVCFARPHAPPHCRDWGSMQALESAGDTLWLLNSSLELGFARFTDSTAAVNMQFVRAEQNVLARLPLAVTTGGRTFPAYRHWRSSDGTQPDREWLLAPAGEPLVLEAWQVPVAAPTSGVTPRHLWYVDQGTLFVFAR